MHHTQTYMFVLSCSTGSTIISQAKASFIFPLWFFVILVVTDSENNESIISHPSLLH